MIIGIDIDDVLSITLPAVLEFHKNKYGIDLEIEGIKDFQNSHFRFIGEGNLDRGRAVYQEFYSSPAFDQIKPISGAEKGVEALKAMGHKLHIVTGRPPMVHDRTKLWLEHYFPGCIDSILFANHISFGANGLSKVDVCREIKAKYLIEDFLPYARECAEDNITVLMLDMPWNQVDDLSPNILRMNSWADIVKYFMENEA